jgi:catechol 2,3-dioxygenase-like lactoylglutathione lyase family enzyme
MKIKFNRLNHIQMCIPHGQEDKAREFYCGLLNIEEIDKPEHLKANGGFWLKVADLQIHIGTEDMKGVSKRHPAFEVDDLHAVKSYLKDSDVRVLNQENVNDFERFSFYDYWDNRIELMQRVK